ncbi:MAG: MarR family transcriptional regulator [Mobilitalea sp.]
MKDNQEENKPDNKHDNKEEHGEDSQHIGEGQHERGCQHRGEHHGRNHQEGIHMGDHRGHGHHGRCMNDNQEEDILSLLGKCSHFLHHKRGGKRGQGKILRILAEHPEIGQRELQELLGIESGSMSEIVIKLENKGFITRTKDETDKRMTKLMITEFGLAKSKEVEARDLEADQSVINSLNAEEQEQLKVLLKKLLQGWEVTFESMRENRCEHEGREGHSHEGRGEHSHGNGRRHRHEAE